MGNTTSINKGELYGEYMGKLSFITYSVYNYNYKRSLKVSLGKRCVTSKKWLRRRLLWSRCYTLKLFAETCVQRRCETCYNRRVTWLPAAFVKLFELLLRDNFHQKLNRFLLLQRSQRSQWWQKREFHRATPLCGTCLQRRCTQVSAKSFNVKQRLELYHNYKRFKG